MNDDRALKRFEHLMRVRGRSQYLSAKMWKTFEDLEPAAKVQIAGILHYYSGRGRRQGYLNDLLANFQSVWEITGGLEHLTATHGNALLSHFGKLSPNRQDTNATLKAGHVRVTPDSTTLPPLKRHANYFVDPLVTQFRDELFAPLGMEWIPCKVAYYRVNDDAVRKMSNGIARLGLGSYHACLVDFVLHGLDDNGGRWPGVTEARLGDICFARSLPDMLLIEDSAAPNKLRFHWFLFSSARALVRLLEEHPANRNPATGTCYESVELFCKAHPGILLLLEPDSKLPLQDETIRGWFNSLGLATMKRHHIWTRAFRHHTFSRNSAKGMPLDQIRMKSGQSPGASATNNYVRNNLAELNRIRIRMGFTQGMQDETCPFCDAFCDSQKDPRCPTCRKLVLSPDPRQRRAEAAKRLETWGTGLPNRGGHHEHI